MGPLMIPRDNYSCDIVRGVPGKMSLFPNSSFYSLLSQAECPRCWPLWSGWACAASVFSPRVWVSGTSTWRGEQRETFRQCHNLTMFQLHYDQGQACIEQQQTRQRGP